MSKYSETRSPKASHLAERVCPEGPGEVASPREIMTPREAADYLCVHVRTIYRLAKNGEIPGRKVGGSWRFKKGALDEWLSWRETPPSKIKR